MATNEIISLGQLVADVVVRPVRGLPASGTADTVEQIELRCGGCGMNTAMLLRKLGVAVGLVGKVGRDVWGEFLLGQLRSLGLDAAGVRQDPAVRTSSVIVLIAPGGERSFLYAPGGNERLTFDDVDLASLKGARILHVGGIMKLSNLDAARVLKHARQMGLTTSMDTDWDSSGGWLKRIESSLAHLDLFLPSLEEARLISGKDDPREIAEFFLKYGIKVFVLKMGKEGCLVRTREREWHLPAYPVSVVDTTGAGDAFVAGFLAGYLKGWDLERCGRLANACGGLCTTRIGTTDGITDLDTTLTFMETGRSFTE